MQTNILPPETPAEVISRLQNNSDKVEHREYYRQLTEEDLLMRREVVSKNTIEVRKINNEMKKAVEGFKGAMKPLLEKTNQYCDEIERGHEHVNGLVYISYDYDNRTGIACNSEGTVVSRWHLTPEEMKGAAQLTIAHSGQF